MQIEGLNRSPWFDNIAPDVGAAKPAMGEYGPEVERYARQYGVDPELVKTILQKESGGAPNPITTMESADMTQLKRESAAELNGRSLTAAEIRDQMTRIESICRALHEESFGSIYDENASKSDGGKE